MKIEELSDVQSEAGIIGTLINHPDFILHSEQLTPNHFYDVTNGCLYWAIQKLHASGIETVDAFNLTSVINESVAIRNKIEKELGTKSLAEMIQLSRTVSRESVEEYKLLVNSVATLHFKRSLLNKLYSCEKECFKEQPVQELQKNVYNALDEVNSEFTMGEETPLFGDIARNLWEQTKSRRSATGLVGLPSKFEELHRYCTYEKGELVMIAAHRKEGKSMLCMNELIDKIKRDVKILYFDTEMSDRLFNDRLLCNLTGIKMGNLLSGNYTSEQEKTIESTLAWLESKKNFKHVYAPSWTQESLYIAVKKMKRNVGLDMLIMDYFKTRDSADASSGYYELGNAVNFVKNDICGELDIAGLGAAQLNRGGEVGDSYKIEQFCSVMMNLKRKSYDEMLRDGQDCGNYKLFIKLNRLGDQMDDIAKEYIDLQFDGSMCQINQAVSQHVYQSTPF